MAARSKARKRALDILFEAELRGLPTLQLLSERQSLGDVPVQPYAAELVRGVASHSERIDELISWNLVDWTLERLPAVDRNILRIGVYELLWADDVPDGVAISEAVTLADADVYAKNTLAGQDRVKPAANASAAIADGVLTIGAVADRVDGDQVCLADLGHGATRAQGGVQESECVTATVQQRELRSQPMHQPEQSGAQRVTAIVVPDNPGAPLEFGQHQGTCRGTDIADFGEFGRCPAVR